MSEQEKPAQPTITRLKTKPLERNLALARLGVGAGARIAAHSIANIFRGNVERSASDRAFFAQQAQILADELGQLKGSVMKAGQMLGLFGDYFLPHEAVEVLAGLQDSTPPVAWSYVAPQLEKALSRAKLDELEIEHTPIAAASLGQAHRAWRKSDRLPLVVKIQYPGVAESVESDVKTLSRLLLASRLTPANLDLTPIFAEVREMLLQECDYQQEADFTEAFGERFATDERVVVPKVLREYSNARVLTTTFEQGVSLQDASVRALPQAARNHLASTFAELFLEEFFDWGLVQTDPNFGNYRVRLDTHGGLPKLVLLDFGACRNFSRDFIRNYSLVVRGALNRDAETLRLGAEAMGLIAPDFPAAALENLAALCASIVEPFNPDTAPPERVNARQEYCFAGSDLPMRVSQMGAKSAMSMSFRMPPREIVFLHRRLGGVFMALVTLNAELDLRKAVAKALQKV